MKALFLGANSTDSVKLLCVSYIIRQNGLYQHVSEWRDE